MKLLQPQGARVHSLNSHRSIAMALRVSSARLAESGSRSRVLAHLIGAGHDLVGPPDPITNLRPVWYRPQFSELRPVSSTVKLHPYSLDEFSSASSSARAAATLALGKDHRKNQARKLERLEKLRVKFEAEDLAWRLQKRRLDQFSHAYWVRSNTAFAKAREAAEERAALTSLSAAGGAGGRVQDPRIMEDFLKSWVDSRSNEFGSFQQEWLKGIFGHLKPAMRAVYRDARWKLELWRCGLA